MRAIPYKAWRRTFSARLSASGCRGALIVLAIAFTSTTAVAEQTHRCISFYGVPKVQDHPLLYEDVDPCWGGGHITVVPFTAYPTGELGPDDMMNAEQALGVPRKIANDKSTLLCKDHPEEIYHMNNGAYHQENPNAYWVTEPHPDDPKVRTLKLGEVPPPPSIEPHPKISTAWKNMALDVGHQNVKTYRKENSSDACTIDPARTDCWNHNYPHVTFDTCSCDQNCQDLTFAEWGDSSIPSTTRIDWLLIPVEYTGLGGDCWDTEHPLPTTKTCVPNHEPPPAEMLCTEKIPLVWHWTRGMTVRCPEPAATAQALFSLLALLFLRRARGWSFFGSRSAGLKGRG